MKIALSFLALLCSLAAASAAEPIPSPKPIFFATGSTSGTAGGRVGPGELRLHSLEGTAGRTLTVTITVPDDNAAFQIYEPGTTIGRAPDGSLTFDGKSLHGPGDGADSTRWSGRLPGSGTYLIVVGSTGGNARYSMDVKIR